MENNEKVTLINALGGVLGILTTRMSMGLEDGELAQIITDKIKEIMQTV